MPVTREDHAFHSGVDVCAVWVYRPDGETTRPRPVVVLGHGLGATREMGLQKYAEHFAEAGIVAAVFDYRYFGASSGRPRQLLSVPAQLADWDAAIAFARMLPGADPDRIAIWGSSFGGGHVIATAARHPELSAAVAQCPFTNGISSALSLGPRSALRLGPAAVLDEVARLTGRPPVRVPLTGRPGAKALMTAPDAESGYAALIPEGAEIDTTVAARIGLRIMAYRPGRAAARIRVPLMVNVAEHDSVARARRTLRHLRKAPTADVRSYPAGHFDIYQGAMFEKVVADQTAFLIRYLRP